MPPTLAPAASAASPAALTPPCRGFVTELLLDSGRGDVAAFGHVVDLFAGIVGARVLDEERSVGFFLALWPSCPSFATSERGAVAWVLDQLAIYGARR